MKCYLFSKQIHKLFLIYLYHVLFLKHFVFMIYENKELPTGGGLIQVQKVNRFCPHLGFKNLCYWAETHCWMYRHTYRQTWVKLNTFHTCRPSSVCACWNAMTVWFPSEFVDVCVIDVTVPVTLAPPNSLLLALPGEGELNLSAAEGPGGDCRISVITINKSIPLNLYL